MASRAYRYKAYEPLVGADLVRKQFSMAHAYYNDLIEMEREHRAARQAAMRSMSPELCRTEKAAEAANSVLDAYYAAERSDRQQRGDAARRGAGDASSVRKPTPQRVQEIEQAKRDRKAAWDAAKSARAELAKRAAWQKRSDELHQQRLAARRALRAKWSTKGLRHGTYSSVEDAVARAVRDRAKRGEAPRFRPWHMRRDRAGEQIQGGLTVEELLACTGRRARLEVRERPNAMPGSRKARKKKFATLWLRVGSTDKREPVWAKVPIRYHRPLPADATVQRVYLTRRDVGTSEEWSVQFVLRRESWAPGDRSTAGSVGVDVGWRLRADGALRVAVWSGSDGEEGEVVLSAGWLSQMRRCEGIRAERDRCFDRVRPGLAVWLAGLRDHRGEDATPWLVKQVQGVHHSRSSQRFARVVLRLKRDDGEDVPEDIELWRAREQHLHEFEAHLRRQLCTRRQTLYRDVAARLSRRYRTIVTENLKLAQLARRPRLETPEDAGTDAMRARRFDASCYSLLSALRERHVESEKVRPHHTTMDCHACGHRNAARADLHFTCDGCGLVWDQDVNAARNLLASSGATLPTRDPLEPSVCWGYDAGGSWFHRHDGAVTVRSKRDV